MKVTKARHDFGSFFFSLIRQESIFVMVSEHPPWNSLIVMSDVRTHVKGGTMGMLWLCVNSGFKFDG